MVAPNSSARLSRRSNVGDGVSSKISSSRSSCSVGMHHRGMASLDRLRSFGLLITLPLGAARGGSFAAGGGAALREEDLFRFEGRISCSSSLIHCWDARGAVSDFPGRRKRGWKEGSRWDFLAYVIVNKVVEVLGRDRGAAAAEHADLVAP